MSALQYIYHQHYPLPEEFSKIIAAHERVIFDKGDFLLKAGAIPNEYFCLEKGLLRSYAIDYTGSEITTGFFCENEIAIDVISLFQRLPSKEYIQALTDVECWKIDYHQFQQLFQSLDGFSEWGRSWMTQSYFDLKQRTLSMSIHSAKERYLNLMQQHPQIIQYAPLKHIASYLGIKDTSLSRIRKEISQ